MNTPYPWLHPIADRLKKQINNPPQALGLVGVSGLGQEILAAQLAQSILKETRLEYAPDFLNVDSEEGKAIGIDKIREVHEFCLIPPTKASRKIVQVNTLEALTLPAQQAFLKTLEEPVIPTTFILVCSAPHRILPTLRSRCQWIALPSVSYQEAKPWLSTQQLEVSEKAYLLCDGGPLLIAQPEFEFRKQAYHALNECLARNISFTEAAKPLIKAHPIDVLTGFYYALMHASQFNLLDTCIALRKQFSDNANLNWEMQLNSFLIEVHQHAR